LRCLWSDPRVIGALRLGAGQTIITPMSVTSILFGGTALHLDPTGAAFFPASRILIVSDLHFEKGSAFARRGVMLPPYDTRMTLKRLADLMAHYAPERVIALGDSFHDGDAEGRMHPMDANRLAALTRQTDWIWILGNHDPTPPERFGGRPAQQWRIDQIILRHEPAPLGEGEREICGHFHPCARILAEGRALRRACFAMGANRLIMPAMGAFTGGLNVLDTAIRPRLDDPMRIFACGRARLYSIPADALLPDAATPDRRRA